MPGCEKSAPKAARPVTLSSPSGLSVRLPIHLLFEPFEPSAVIAALPVPFWTRFGRDLQPKAFRPNPSRSKPTREW
jgi:hypothetical protein